MTEKFCKITFIIPTIGRSTLSNTLNSLIHQTNPNWKAIVIFDDISSTIQNIDSRIRIIKSPKLGQGHNSAGLVRNYGIRYADTEWVAFVDDDDHLSNDYVEIFLKEITTYSSLDIIIFRMVFNNNIIYPLLETDMFYQNNVGISFTVKKQLFDEQHIFIPSSGEDFNYLNEAKNKNYKIMISPHITYFVRNSTNSDSIKLGTRVFINYTDQKESVM